MQVLQRIFNKEPRLVIPIIMRTPKLLRTDMDKVCYAGAIMECAKVKVYTFHYIKGGGVQ
eukprot:1160161-Pelagomonas_calceolata.AAC.1